MCVQQHQQQPTATPQLSASTSIAMLASTSSGNAAPAGPVSYSNNVQLQVTCDGDDDGDDDDGDDDLIMIVMTTTMMMMMMCVCA